MIKRQQGADLFIVDNSDDLWKVGKYLHDWCEIAKSMDIATGCFEIGSLLSLDGQWQKLGKIRILMGDEVTKRTKQAFVAALKNVTDVLDDSLENEKETNDFLDGVPAVVKALQTGQIECRVYRKRKFHAKAYITHAKLDVVGPAALVGSSNFTRPGLTENVELNVQVRREVNLLQQWFDEHWKEAEDVTPHVRDTIERHIREYSPFDVYAKSLQEFFSGHEMTATEWEKTKSKMFNVLDQYQKEAYQALMKIAPQYGGAFLCDGVGLGKTYVGLMLIERLVRDRKNVALFVPKSALEDVWRRYLDHYLPDLGSSLYSRLSIFSHTDLLRTRGGWQRDMDRVKEMADVIVIDEAHHFRNPGTRPKDGKAGSRYWRFYDICEGKNLYLLTATPVNNRLIDLQHMIELFSRRNPDHFKAAPLGIHSLPGHFRKLEKALEAALEVSQLDDEGASVQTNQAEAQEVLWEDDLFRALVVQRSRAYVKESQRRQGRAEVIFPKREPPRVAEYKLRKTYGRLLDMVERAFEKTKPLFALAVYYPLANYIGPDMEKKERAWRENRQKQLVGLIRTLFLKRFESSAQAFEFSCEMLFNKLRAWVIKHSKPDSEKRRLELWERQHEQLIGHVRQHQMELFPKEAEQEEDAIEQELLQDIDELSPQEYNVQKILDETYLDLDELAQFLTELKRFKPANDDKLKALIKLLKADADLKDQKVLIFTEFMATASYLKKQLDEAGITDVDEVDSASKRDRSEIIRAFAPCYNQPQGRGLMDGIKKETRVLISTDVLSEGLNLQDATRLINYDLHWNPVRLMQRIGRIDRRLDPEIEAQMRADRPELNNARTTVIYWNFLPPDELDNLLRLYQVVSRKTLRISKVFGIEGKKLLRPEDDYEAFKDFEHEYEGEESGFEKMHLEYQDLLRDNPGLEESLKELPRRVFSGKQHPRPGTQAVFFCYFLPTPSAKDKEAERSEGKNQNEEPGFAKWYLYDLATEKIADEPSEIVELIRSTPETPRHRTAEKRTLSEIRAQMDKHIKNTYLKQVQVPTTIGLKPILKAWMELS